MSSEPSRVLNADQQLGARVAFGPRHTGECLEVWRMAGYHLLMKVGDPKDALLGGLLIRVADLEGLLAERGA